MLSNPLASLGFLACSVGLLLSACGSNQSENAGEHATGGAVSGRAGSTASGGGATTGGTQHGGAAGSDSGGGSGGLIGAGGSSNAGGTAGSAGNAGSLASAGTGGLPSAVDYGSIDVSRLPVEPWKDTQWKDPGGWTTIDVSARGLPANNAGIDASLKIAEIVNSTSGRRKLFFPKGIYYFKSSLTLNVGDLWLEGAGAQATLFRIDAPASSNAQILFRSGAPGGQLAVSVPPKRGDTTISLADASSLKVGDIVQLFADTAPLFGGGESFGSECYAQIFRVMATSGNVITLDMKVLLDYPASYTPRAHKFNLLSNIKVSRIKVERVNEPTLENVSNLGFYGVANAHVDAIESSFSGRNHIFFHQSKDCVVTDSYVHDTWKHATGGYGYGISLATTTGCRITNNKAARLRHHLILSMGANHSVVSYNSVESPWHYNDVALHASYAYMNLFEGNAFTEGYADQSKDGGTVAEPTTGPGNTWFRNYAMGQVGCIQGATKRQNVIGNYLRTVRTAGSDHYVGGNSVAGVLAWGVFKESAEFPASLYLTRKPTFFASSTWPVYGPGLADWGAKNQVPAAATPALAERVKNSGFEAGSLAPWTAGAVFSVSKEDVHSGTYAVKLSGAGAWANLAQNVAVEKLTPYTWSLWAKSTSDSARLKVLTPTSDVLQECGSTIGDGSWRLYYCNFSSGDNTSVRLYIGDSGAGTHYFDDARVY